MKARIMAPAEYIGPIMTLGTERRGVYKNMTYLDTARVEFDWEFPLAEIILDFFDKLKTISRGYASLDYDMLEYRASDLVKLDMLINGDPIDAFSVIIHRDKSYEWGRKIADKLKELIPRQLFEVAIQAAIGNKVIARTTVKPLRKDVLAKCYGGDITRKRKLLEKQKEGKKRMKQVGVGRDSAGSVPRGAAGGLDVHERPSATSSESSLVIQTSLPRRHGARPHRCSRTSRSAAGGRRVHAGGGALLANHPAVRERIVYDKRGADRGVARLPSRARRRFASARYDSAYLAQGSVRSGALALAAGIPDRVGFATSAGRAFYTTRIARADERASRRAAAVARHARRDATMSRDALRPRLYPGAAERAAVDALLGTHDDGRAH